MVNADRAKKLTSKTRPSGMLRLVQGGPLFWWLERGPSHSRTWAGLSWSLLAHIWFDRIV